MRRNLPYKWAASAVVRKITDAHPKKPIVYGVFVTNRCNFRCRYCDNGKEEKFPEMKLDELSTRDLKRVFDRVREDSNMVAVCGGEPLVRRDIEEVLRHAREIGFKRIVMNTNSWGILDRLEILDYLDDLMVSLDSMNEDYSDYLFNVRPGITKEVVRNLKILTELQSVAGFRLIVNSVISAENLTDIFGVMEFCIRQGIAFSPAPCLVGPYPQEALKDNPAYAHLIDSIMKLKSRGMKVLETMDFLKGVRNFSRFKCLPSLYQRVNPLGELEYPCMILSKGEKVKVLDHPTMKSALHAAGTKFDIGRLDCDNRCHLSCYMETSRAVTNPLAVLREGMYVARSRIKSRKGEAGRKRLLSMLDKLRKSMPPGERLDYSFYESPYCRKDRKKVGKDDSASRTPVYAGRK